MTQYCEYHDLSSSKLQGLLSKGQSFTEIIRVTGISHGCGVCTDLIHNVNPSLRPKESKLEVVPKGNDDWEDDIEKQYVKKRKGKRK